MAKRWIAFGLLFGFAGFAAFVSGCGQVTSTSTTSPTNVTFSGASATSSADLNKLGVTSLGVETLAQENSRISNLKALGFDEVSVRTLNLVPLAASADTYATLNKVNADGSYTVVDTEKVGTGGTYKLTDEAYKSSNSYVVTVSKEANGKIMLLETIVDSKASSSTSTGALTDINSSPQTTLLMQTIRDKIVKALGTNALDPETIKLVKDLIIARINLLVTTEGMSISTVRANTETENTSMKDAAVQSFSDEIVQKAINAIKFKSAFSKGATDLPTAKKVIKDVFTFITGSPTGIPENIVNSFAQSYFDGVTKTIAQLADACNKSAMKNGTQVTNLFTATNIAAEMKSKISGTFNKVSGLSALAEPRFEVKSMNPVVQAVFPASEWVDKSIDGSTVLNVPQIILLIEIGEKIAGASGAQFNPPKVAFELGLMTGIKDEFSVMHSEVRVESFENWEGFMPDPNNPNSKPTVEAVLASFVDVGNMVNPAAVTTGLTARLRYLKADGSAATANYTKLTGGFGPKIEGARAGSVRAMEEQMGPPPGFVMFQIMPWGGPTTATKITDYKKGSTATIEILNNGAVITSQDVVISAVDLSTAQPTFKSPLPNVFSADDPQITVFQTGTKPACEWLFGTVGSTNKTIDFGTLKSAYAIEIRRVSDLTGQPDFQGGAVFSSWNKQDFIDAKENETARFTIPLEMTAGTYSIMVAVLAIDSSGWPLVSGPWRSTLFKVGAASAINAKMVTIEGTVTPPTTLASGKTIKVGLFKMEWDMNFAGATITPVKVATVTDNAYSMTINYSDLVTKGNGGYDTIAWEDDGTGLLEGGAGERPYFPAKHLGYFNGMLNAMDSNFRPLGPVTPTQNNTGYNIDMSQQFWGP